ncbi:MAG TPA: hypothetical protein VNZ44_00835, partial [Pyrinomonadaceae bacterium]|nr:hypothetical protein [Pyrinomonadaceae bacterium]
MTAVLFLAALALMPALRTARAHGGEDDEKKPAAQAAAAGGAAAPVRTAERNVQTPDGQFKVRLRQSPPDPRAGEEAQFAVELAEKVEGGFGDGGEQHVEGATVTARVTTAAGAAVVSGLATHAEGEEHGLHYAFRGGGEYKVFFDVRT